VSPCARPRHWLAATISIGFARCVRIGNALYPMLELVALARFHRVFNDFEIRGVIGMDGLA
jgi:hypothetical protein